LTIVSSSAGSIAGMQKMGPVPFTEAEVMEAIDMACEKAAELRGLYLEGLANKE